MAYLANEFEDFYDEIDTEELWRLIRKCDSEIDKIDESCRSEN